MVGKENRPPHDCSVRPKGRHHRTPVTLEVLPANRLDQMAGRKLPDEEDVRTMAKGVGTHEIPQAGADTLDGLAQEGHDY